MQTTFFFRIKKQFFCPQWFFSTYAN